MSSGGGGSGGGGDHHGVYHQHGYGHLARADADAGAEYVFHSSNDMESFFFNQPASSAGVDGSGSRTGATAELMPPYSSITDYLQGFLQDPSGLARHLDAPCPAEDAPIKHELSVDLSHDSQGTSGAPGEGAAMHTPNSSVSLSSSDREGEGQQPRRCKKGRPKAEDAEGDEKEQEDGENSTKAYVLFSLILLICVFIDHLELYLHLSSSGSIQECFSLFSFFWGVRTQECFSSWCIC